MFRKLRSTARRIAPHFLRKVFLVTDGSEAFPAVNLSMAQTLTETALFVDFSGDVACHLKTASPP